MKKILSVVFWTLAFLLMYAVVSFAQSAGLYESTGVAPPENLTEKLTISAVLTAILGIYEILIGVIPTMKSWSLLTRVVHLIEELLTVLKTIRPDVKTEGGSHYKLPTPSEKRLEN